MFEFIGTNNTESCSPSARSSQMQPAEHLLAHILVKPTCALIDPGQVEDGRGELVKVVTRGLQESQKYLYDKLNFQM